MLARTHGSCTRNEVGLGDVGNLADNGYPHHGYGKEDRLARMLARFLSFATFSKPRLSLIHDGRAGGLSQSASPPFPGTTSRSEFAATA